MRFSCFGILAFPLLVATLPAQPIPQLGPGVVKWSATSTPSTTPIVATRAPFLGAVAIIGATSTPTLIQLELRNHTAANIYRYGATLTGVPAALGGLGGQDIVESRYNAVTKVVTPTANAATLNSAANEFQLSISEDGRIATVDAPNPGPFWASRANINGPFGARAAIVGVPRGFIDGKLFTEGNVLKYAWVQGTDIWNGDFNPITGTVTNQALRIPASVAVGAQLHSPHPVSSQIPAGSGNWVVHGWIFSVQRAGGDSDTWFLPLSRGTTAITNAVAYELFDNAGWQNNGTTLGSSGTLFIADNGAGDPWCIPIVSINSAAFSAANGGPVRLHATVEYSPTDAWVAAVLFGPGLGPLAIGFGNHNPLSPAGQTTVPQAMLGIGPIVSIQLPVAPGGNGSVDLSFLVGPGAIPAGVPIGIQSLGINFTTGQFVSGNTAVIEGQ